MLDTAPRRSISRKLATLVVAAIGAAVVVLMAAAVWFETRQYAETKRQSLLATAQVFASATGPSTAAADHASALHAMRAIGQIPGLVHARIERGDGSVLASIGSGALLDTDLRTRPDSERRSAFAVLASRSIQVSVAIRDSGLEVGRFVLVSDTADLIDRLISTLWMIAFAGACALAVGLLVAARFQRGIAQPIVRLTNTVAEIRASHDYGAQVPGTSDDEVGLLVDGFNAMLREIQDRDTRLDTHRRNLEQEVVERTQDLRVAKDAAEAANAAKSDFLATMSHEIRTPMNGIMVMAELLAAGDMPQRQRRYAEVIAKSGQSLIAVINDILDLSKIESGKLDLESVPVDLAELADDVTSLFGERARSKGVDLASFVAPDVPRRVDGDPVRLNQVIGNLINNALKFTESGSVLLTIERDPVDDATVRIAVSDTGIGIPEDKRDSIFGAFSQADQSTTRRFGGTGLGLAICKRLVAAMGGDITVTSEVGRGSTFAFAIRPEVVDPAAAWPTRNSGVAGTGVVVIGATGDATRASLARYLAASGFDVVDGTAVSGDRLSAASLVLGDADWVAALPALPASGTRAVLCLCPLGDTAGARIVASGRAAGALSWPLMRSEIVCVVRCLAAGQPVSMASTARPGTAGELPQFPGLRVLVADDSAVNREVAVEAFSQFGITPALAEDGRAAIAAVAAREFDLVLMDGSMPDVDGFEAARRIRAHEVANARPRLPIVALTAHVVGASANAWRDAGMDAVLHKPFTLKALADCISQFVTPVGTGPKVPPVVDAETPPEPAAVAPAPALLDVDVLQQLDAMAAAGRTDFVQRVVGLYLEHAPAAVARLAHALGAHDADAVAVAAHALKSMSYNVGAADVARRAAAIEARARAAAPELDEVDLVSLRASMTETCDALAARIAPAGALAAPAEPAGSVEASPLAGQSGSAEAGDDSEALIGDLRHAIANGELRTVYQPLVDRSGKTTMAVEALVRWTRPRHGDIGPATFIPLAETSGDIVTIGEWVLRQACRDATRWPGLTISVNISSVQIQQPDFVEVVERVLAETGLDPKRLDLEIVETAMLTASEHTHRVMRLLRDKGVSFSLDDFGTGYSSLMYLRQFPFERIKIDRGFVGDIENAIDAATIVHAVVSIGRALGMKVVAEGVETPEQQRFLAAAGVHLMQGYLFGHPASVDDITQRLTEEASPAAPPAPVPAAPAFRVLGPRERDRA